MESAIESSLPTLINKETRPSIFYEFKERVFNRFEDPRNCKTLEDVVGKKVDGRISKSRRLDWAPRKIDISRISEVIRFVKQRNDGRSLKVVDIAGHSGFLDRLILDELDQKIGSKSDINITVVDPDKIVTREGHKYYQKQKKNRE